MSVWYKIQTIYQTLQLLNFMSVWYKIQNHLSNFTTIEIYECLV